VVITFCGGGILSNPFTILGAECNLEVTAELFPNEESGKEMKKSTSTMKQPLCYQAFVLVLEMSYAACFLFADDQQHQSTNHHVLYDGIHTNKLDLKILSRSLQEMSTDQDLFIPPCNTLLGSMTADELRAVASGIVSAFAPDPESFEYTYLESVLVSPIQYGIHVHRICAGCQDVASQVVDDAQAAAVYETFCGPDNYGAVNATFTGLMIVPLSDDETILEGTLKGVIDMHATATAVVPSLMWTMMTSTIDEDMMAPDLESQEFILLQLDAILAGTGLVLVFPDYMGYAENSLELYKGYTIKKAYQTSCVPVVLWARQYLRELTECATELATTVGIKGYSEGGYTAVVLADSLYRMGWNVVQVHAGGGPYDLIAASTKTFELLVNGLYNMRFSHILALVGSSYSSTYMDLPNYQQNQDMLTDSIRLTLVDIIANNTPEPLVRESMQYDDPVDLLRQLFDAEYLDFVNASVTVGNMDPCGSTPQEELEQQNVDKICKAFQLNVIAEMLQNAPFKISVCHSADDEVVPAESVPDLSGNDNVVFIPAQGSHNEAGGECIFGALLYYLGTEFRSLTVEPLHSTAGCDAPIGSPVATLDSSSEITSTAPMDELHDEQAGISTTIEPTDEVTEAGTSGSFGVKSLSCLIRVLTSVAVPMLWKIIFGDVHTSL
jgi:hypothetical protein